MLSITRLENWKTAPPQLSKGWKTGKLHSGKTGITGKLLNGKNLDSSNC